MTPSSTPQKLLVVDDERPILGLIRSFLATKGVECETTTEPAEAIRILEGGPVDVLVTDVHMKECSGVELLERAREIDPETLVILMTGRPTVETAVRSLKSQAYDYITKPFELEDLYAVVRRALEKQRLRRENSALKDTLALYRITQAVTAAVDEHEVLETVLETTRRELGADRAAIYLTGAGGRLERWPEDGGDADSAERAIAESVREGGRPLLTDGSVDGSFLERSTSAAAAPILGRKAPIGALVALRETGGRPLDEGHLQVLLFLAGSAATAIQSARAARRVVETRAGLVEANAATIGALVAALDAREHETQAHSLRVTECALHLGRKLGMRPEDLVHLKFGAMLHDIGKIGISDSILLKPGPLTEGEWEEMRRHPMIGYHILRDIEFLEQAAKIVLYHQERYDGSGYPFGLAGEDIPLGARLFAVVDVFDAITNDRPYRAALTYGDALAHLADQRGALFDPRIVDTFLTVPEEEWRRICETAEESGFAWEHLSPRGELAGIEVEAFGETGRTGTAHGAAGSNRVS